MKKLTTLFQIIVIGLLALIAFKPTPQAAPVVERGDVQLASFQQQQAEQQLCTIVQKANGGYVVDCDPYTPPSAEPSATQPNPTETSLPVFTATNTLLPPNTPTITKTSTPPPPPTITPGGSIASFRGAPLCSHDNATAYHGLWDYQRGCHYDHTHGDDPALGNSIFGTAGSWGYSISYPWATPNENDINGHKGYVYYVNMNPSPACANEGYEYLGSVNCVSAFRILYHDAGGNAHMVKRFHSYYMEVQIKRGNTVGFIKTGGWADFGCLHSSYKETFLPLPSIDPVNSSGQSVCGNGQSIHSDPYRAFGNTWAEVQNGAENWAIWTSHNRYGYNRLGFFFFRTLDAWGAQDASDPYAEHFICEDGGCEANNSEHHVFNVYMMIPSSLDTDRDGIVNYSGYTDRKGNIVQGCTSPGLDCVPLQIVNAPVGTAIWSRNLSGLTPAGDPVHDFDIYFNGQPSGWIQFHQH